MVAFPNCKLNLGLYVVRKRADGYHDLQTVFYPLNWCDALEVIALPNDQSLFNLQTTGLALAGNVEDNLLYKCWQMVREDYPLPPLKVHLHKNIPMGAGLGGGSSDAAFFLELLNSKFELHIPLEKRLTIAGRLGADCPFFILNRPVFAEGKGDVFSDIEVDLSAFYILCIFPKLHSNTALAFKSIVPKLPEWGLRESIEAGVSKWRETLSNDFETPVFTQFPILAKLKAQLYEQGAIYASMSGSGSAVFGIFEKEPALTIAENYLYFLQSPAAKTL